MAPLEMTALALGKRSTPSLLANALIGNGISHGVSVTRVAVPMINANEVLVKVHAVACNPTDVGHIDIVGPANAIIGCDFAGLVEEVGPEASAKWKKGDRIAGVVHGGLFPDKGSFAEYLKVEADLAWRPPQNLSDQEAATYGISAVTAMQGLYTQIGMSWPDEAPVPTTEQKVILVYAGSTAASLFAIQLAKLAGCTVVTTCSPHNTELVKSYGADAVYDYHSPTALQDVKKAYPNISSAFDGISLTQSTRFCSEALGSSGGKVVVLLDTRKKNARKDVEICWILMYTLLGQPFGFFRPIGPKWDTAPADRAALVRFYGMLHGLSSTIKPPPVKPVSGGFEGLLEGLNLLRTKKVSGGKLVVDLL